MKQESYFGALRVAFGFAWAADAYLKWSPAIRGDIITVLTQAQQGQPAWEQAWINVWVHVAQINPLAFGTLIALVETALALSLITGVLSRWAIPAGFAFALLIWSVPQGFGGPYAPDTTDIDSGIIYALMFAALWVGSAWKSLNLGKNILGNWAQ